MLVVKAAKPLPAAAGGWYAASCSLHQSSPQSWRFIAGGEASICLLGRHLGTLVLFGVRRDPPCVLVRLSFNRAVGVAGQKGFR